MRRFRLFFFCRRHLDVYMNRNVSTLDNSSSFVDTIQVTLHTYFLPIILLSGLIGNTVTIAVFLGTYLVRQTTSLYLAYLAAVDFAFLLGLTCTTFLGHLNLHMIHKHGFCQLFNYILPVTTYQSVWTVVCFTIERFIIVYKPFLKQQWCKRKNTKRLLLIITVSGLLLYSYTIWSNGIVEEEGKEICRPRHFHIHKAMILVDTVVTCILPSCLLLIFNVSIMVKVVRFVQKRKKFADPTVVIRFEKKSSSSTSSIRTEGRRIRVIRSCTKLQLRTTRTLLIVSTVFIALNLPSHLYRMPFVFGFYSASIVTSQAVNWQAIFQFLFYTSFSFNFYLYSACSKSFRTAFQALLAKIRYNFTKCHVSISFTRHRRRLAEVDLENLAPT